MGKLIEMFKMAQDYNVSLEIQFPVKYIPDDKNIYVVVKFSKGNYLFRQIFLIDEFLSNDLFEDALCERLQGFIEKAKSVVNQNSTENQSIAVPEFFFDEIKGGE